ncbi:MAG TPA: DUF2182 domain-containing protein [Longimicrobium sp.]
MPLIIVVAAAWLVLALRPAHDGHGSMHGMGWTPASLVVEAVLMFAAMMLPLTMAPVRHVRDCSPAGRGGWAVALFAAGYALPWIAAGAVLLAAAQWMSAAEAPALPWLTLVAVAVFQASPAKQWCLNRCHAHSPLAASGARGKLEVLRFGLRHAGWCIGSCAALMLLPMLLTRGHLAAMAGVMVWIAGERLQAPAPPRWRWSGPENMVPLMLARLWTLLMAGRSASARARLPSPAVIPNAAAVPVAER